MKTFLILISWFSCVAGSELPQLFLKLATPQELSEIQKDMSIFYAQELFEAGVFEDKNEALKAAIEESNTRDSDEVVFYYSIVSKKPETKYGYMVYSVKAQTAYLEAIYLEKEYRGRGLVKPVLQDFEKELRKNGIDTLELYVFAHNQTAYKLYENMGFVIKNAYSNNNKPIGYQMEKVLRKNL